MIIIGADHAGFELKEKIKKFLITQNEDIVDVGAFKSDNQDNFSDFVLLMIKTFENNKNSRIIAVCGSGVGMCIGLNKHKGILCANVHNVAEVTTARQHNNINALALGGRVISLQKAKQIVLAFLNTEALGGKYQDRMNTIEIK